MKLNAPSGQHQRSGLIMAELVFLPMFNTALWCDISIVDYVFSNQELFGRRKLSKWEVQRMQIIIIEVSNYDLAAFNAC